MAVQVTGEVVSVKLESRPPFRPNYYSPAEHLEFYLAVCLQLDDGSKVYFNSPHATRSVASCPGAAVVTFDISPNAADWLQQVGEVAVATPESRRIGTLPH